MDHEKMEDDLTRIKRTAILALYEDEKLMSRLVLKGGNLLDIVYNVDYRASLDLDFSIEDDFLEAERQDIKQRIQATLERAYLRIGYIVFDLQFEERPKHLTEDMKDFWGGYRIEFKIIDQSRYKKSASLDRVLRMQALNLGPGNRKAFQIDISKFEYCRTKRPREIEGCTVYVYSPEMVVFEKLRAICQQMPEYSNIVQSPSRSPRARDFYDIYTVLENFSLDLMKHENAVLLKNIFQAKRVPLKFIGTIAEYREYHRQDFPSVLDTVKNKAKLKDFDFYFDYVVDHCCDKLKSFWNI